MFLNLVVIKAFLVKLRKELKIFFHIYMYEKENKKIITDRIKIQKKGRQPH